MSYKDIHFFAVTTRHGDYTSFHTLEEARQCALRHMEGYLNGLTCNNDPKPIILRIEEVEMLSFDEVKKSAYIRVGGASFGSYHDFDCNNPVYS